jgi:phage/plasmid-like protein (TIGR03299 family)
MFSVKVIPWHKLGKILNSPPTSAEAIVEAGLDWEVEKKQIYWKSENNEYIPYTKRNALVRTRDNNPLSVVSDSYKPLQNKVAFEWFDPIVKAGDATYETAGSLQGGKKIWILAKLKRDMEVVKGDEVRNYLLLANGHDGVTGIMIQPSNIRTVCENTLLQSLGTGLVTTIWHHGDISEKMDRIKRLLGLAEKQFEQKHEMYKAMANFPVNDTNIAGYVHHLIPNANEEATERIKESVTAAQEKIWELAETGLGTDIPGVKGTMWGLYSSAIEFGDYYMPRKVRDLASYQLFGLGSQFKKRAYDKALEMIGA